MRINVRVIFESPSGHTKMITLAAPGTGDPINPAVFKYETGATEVYPAERLQTLFKFGYWVQPETTEITIDVSEDSIEQMRAAAATDTAGNW